MTRGHVLVATRGHRVKVEDLAGGEGESVGESTFYMVVAFNLLSVPWPCLSRQGGLCETACWRL
jgi:hypothetical protein